MKFLLLGLLGLTGCSIASVSDPKVDRDSIRSVVREHFGEVEKCYLKAIEERPGASGKVVVTWEINPEGAVVSKAIKEADPKITAIEPCLLTTIQGWSFPKLDKDSGTVSVNYPFFFSENGQFEAKPK